MMEDACWNMEDCFITFTLKEDLKRWMFLILFSWKFSPKLQF